MLITIFLWFHNDKGIRSLFANIGRGKNNYILTLLITADTSTLSWKLLNSTRNVKHFQELWYALGQVQRSNKFHNNDMSKRKIIFWFTFSKLRVVQVHSLSQFQDLWWSGYIFGKQCWITHWTYRIWLSSIALFKCQPPLAIEYQVQVPFLNSGDTEETCFYCQFKLTF